MSVELVVAETTAALDRGLHNYLRKATREGLAGDVAITRCRWRVWDIRRRI